MFVTTTDIYIIFICEISATKVIIIIIIIVISLITNFTSPSRFGK